MMSKHVFIGFLALLGVASSVTACGGVDGEGSEEEWATDEDFSSAPLVDTAVPLQDVVPKTVPNCGIIACPDGTVCMFDSGDEAVCAAPDALTCKTVNCGAYHYCVMKDIGAVCMPGSSDI